ncbi:hypothetical protein CRUP_038297 [Coryphaenoides rupestris]|nr:hypothetical protein CRUP_038297 [Coryphaenoides rupestris]
METMPSPCSAVHSQYTLLMISSGGQTLIPEERCAIKGEPARHVKPDLVLKRQRPGSPQQRHLFRCVKRTYLDSAVDLPDPDQPHRPPFVASVARRNERERNRVRQVNAGFQTLRQHVPNGAANGKLSKVETLRSAVEYIRALQRLLHSSPSMSAAAAAAFESMEVPPPSSPSVSSGLSMGPESPHSTCSSSASEEGAAFKNGTFMRSDEEAGLLDFTAWLHRYTELSSLASLQASFNMSPLYLFCSAAPAALAGELAPGHRPSWGRIVQRGGNIVLRSTPGGTSNGLWPLVTPGPTGGRKARDGPGSLWRHEASCSSQTVEQQSSSVARSGAPRRLEVGWLALPPRLGNKAGVTGDWAT